MVLIDTWWNVNVDASGSPSFTSRVLIDTWWNVNSNSAPQEPEEEKF